MKNVVDYLNSENKLLWKKMIMMTDYDNDDNDNDYDNEINVKE